MQTYSRPDDYRSEDIDGILEQYGPYISVLARSYAQRILYSGRVGIIEDEIEDIAQEARVRLWETIILRRKRISHPKAYIHRVIRNLCVDRTRRTLLLPLPENTDGELLQGNVLIIPGEDLQDPAHEFEQKEMLVCGCAALAAEIFQLPYVQRCAVVAWLKEHRDEASLLVLQNLKRYGLDIHTISCPKRADEVQRQRASLWAARKKLRNFNFFV